MPNERQQWAPAPTIDVMNARLRRVVDVLDASDRYDIKSVSASATVVLTYPRTLYKVTTSGGNVTMTLPPARTAVGMRVEFKKMSAANTLTIDADGAETIDGSLTVALTTQYTGRSMVSDGTSDWSIV
jgi:hypothetical protein